MRNQGDEPSEVRGGGVGDLSELVRENLERKGIISDLKGKIRAEIFHTLEEKSISATPKPTGAIFLASQLIRDYLNEFELNNTASVFNEEAGQPSEARVDRHFLGEELGLNLKAPESKVPLLVLLVEYLQMKKGQPSTSAPTVSDSLELEGFEYHNT